MTNAGESQPVLSPIFPLRGTRLTWIAYLLLMGAVSTACFGSLADHLLDTHDAETFKDNIATSQNFSYFFLPASQKALGSGRPVAELVKWAAYLIWDNNPAWFHLLVVAVHSLASFLLARLAWRLSGSIEESFLGGLLFLVNVAHFQAVHWISALDYPLALAWGIGAMLCYLQYMETQRRHWLLCFYGSLTCGALSHLSMLMVWPLCLYWVWHQGHNLRAALHHLLPFGLILMPTMAFIFYLTAEDTSTWHAIDSYSLSHLVSILVGMARLLLWFASRLLTTAHWMPLPVYRQQGWELLIGLGVLAGLGALIWKKRFPAAFWAMWVLLMLLPFLILTEEVVKDLPAGPSRYLYLSTAGSSLLIAWLLERGSLWLGPYLKPRILHIGMTALLLASSFIYLKKSEALTFYTSGRSYLVAGDAELGIKQLQRAIARDTGTIPLLDAYSRLCLQLMGTDELKPTLDQALQNSPKDLYLNLFRLAALSMSPDPMVQQQTREKLASLVNGFSGEKRKNAELVLTQSYANFGLNRTKRNDFKGAIPAYSRALEFNPENSKIRQRLVLALMAAGQTEEATAQALQVLRLNPDDPSSPGLRALVLRLQGKVDEAILICRRALAANPVEDLFSLLGECYEYKGELDKAREVYQQCLSLFPHYQPARQRLAELASQPGDHSSAIEALEKAIDLDPGATTKY